MSERANNDDNGSRDGETGYNGAEEGQMAKYLGRAHQI